MSRFEARVTAYDVFSTVHVSARVWDTNGNDPAFSEAQLEVSTSQQGEGIAEPREWLREALLALLEQL